MGGFLSLEAGRQKLSAEIVTALPACCSKPNVSITRGELASLFRVSARTIARWQQSDCLPHERKNARVIRYGADAVLAIAAKGIEIDRTECTRLGFRTDEILALATKLKPADGPKQIGGIVATADTVFVATTSADRKVIELLRHPIHGDYVRKFAEAIRP